MFSVKLMLEKKEQQPFMFFFVKLMLEKKRTTTIMFFLQLDIGKNNNNHYVFSST